MSVEFHLKKKKVQKFIYLVRKKTSGVQNMEDIKNMEAADGEGVLKELRWNPGCVEDFYQT